MATVAGSSEYSPAELVQRWEEFFEANDYSGRILAVADAYPEIRTLEVPYGELDRFDTDFAIFLLRRPANAIAAGEEAVTRVAPPGDAPIHVHVRVKGVPRDLQVLVRDLRTERLGHYVTIEGLVRAVTEVHPQIVDARFQCLRCGAVLAEPQDRPHFQEPLECYSDQGGCARSAGATKFKLLGEKSQYVDTQSLEVQDPPELLRGGEQPTRLMAILEDDLTGQVAPGERAVLSGILRSAQRGRPGARKVDFDLWLEVHAIERERTEFEDLEILEGDVGRIREEAAVPDVLSRIRMSIAPTIYGMEREKEVLALQLFGGVPKAMPDGTRIRGDPNVLLIGDPSTAKSQLLFFMARIAPRAILASGKGASAAGLIGAAVKDSLVEGRWTIEAGALVLADKGLCVIDELEKMSPQDRGSIHMAIEQQIVAIDKAGLHMTMPARCAVLAAANPKLGRWVQEKLIGEQLEGLEPALLSRFDAILPVVDIPNKAYDAETASHILHAHRLGEVLRARAELAACPLSEDAKTYEPYYDEAFLRKYVAYAKRLTPVMTDEALARLQTYYVNERSNGGGADAPVPITRRQLEALVRWSEASARARLSEIVEPADAQRAIGITEYWLRQVASAPGAKGIDIDIVATGIPASQREEMVALRDIIAELGGTETGPGATQDDILSLAEQRGIPRDRADAWLRKWRQEGDLYSPVAGRHKLVSRL